MALVYMIVLSTLSFFFLVRVRYFHLSEVFTYSDEVRDYTDLSNIALSTLAYLVSIAVDVLKDTLKYILMALVIAIFSFVIYALALLNPRRWMTYSLLVLGVALCWASIVPPQELIKLYAGSGIIVQITVSVIGHIYVLTSVWQFQQSIKNKYYFDGGIDKLKKEKTKWIYNGLILVSILATLLVFVLFWRLGLFYVIAADYFSTPVFKPNPLTSRQIIGVIILSLVFVIVVGISIFPIDRQSRK